jgi:hypothetical protein
MGMLFSCDKNEDNGPEETQLSEDEVAEVLESSFSKTNGGLTEELESTSEEMESMDLQAYCDSLFQDTLNYEYNGANAQASANIGWVLDLTCNGLNVPQSAIMALGTEVSFNTSRISSIGTSTFNGSLSGLQFSSPVITWNGTYTRSAASDFRFRQQNKGNTDLNLTLTEVAFDKEDLFITSGTGTYILTVTINGNSETFEGTITFNGDQTATVVINGEEFVIDLR